MPTKKASSSKIKPAATRKKKVIPTSETAEEVILEQDQQVISIAPDSISESPLPVIATPLIKTTSVATNATPNPVQSSSSASSHMEADRNMAAKKNTIPPREEKFDLNTVTLSGAIHNVWGSGDDVFARLGVSKRGLLVEEEDADLIYVTLRFADGAVAGQPISIQKGSLVKVRGYLTHREYNESLRKFLNDVHAQTFFDLVPADDLPAWRNLTLKRHNGVMNVLEMIILDRAGAPTTRFGFEGDDSENRTTRGSVVQNHDGHDSPTAENHAKLEGIVARIWEYPRDHEIDTFVRLAVYDAYTPVNPKRERNFGRPQRLAHYVTVRFPCGKTSSGSIIRLKTKMRIRVTGELQHRMWPATLREELVALGKPFVIKMMQRVQNAERMDEIKSQQESLHILANAVVVYSFGGGSRA